MSNIVYFDIGCRNCTNLTQVGKGTYTCSVLDYDDGSNIYPIVDGKHTDDWGACGGESRQVRANHRRKRSS